MSMSSPTDAQPTTLGPDGPRGSADPQVPSAATHVPPLPPPLPSPSLNVLQALRNDVSAQVNRLVVGQQRTIDALLVAAAVGGHVLLEGPPGVAKTLLARVWSQVLGVTFRRVQFTPDMLPSDLTGTVALRQSSDGALVFRPGPIFANVVLADEINRTPPKTQAALLEAMQEQQVTVDGTSHALPRPFLVVATQNPIEYEGTYPLPEAQLDRFLLQIDIGYPSADDEVALLKLGHHGTAPIGLDDLRPVATADRLLAARSEVDATRVYDEVMGYIAALVRATRVLPSVLLGASPRAGVHLLAAAKAVARLNGRDFVTPDDVAALAAPVLGHRLVLRSEATLDRFRPADAIATVLATVPVPR
jgi:MoxR-like ATPase